MIHKQKEKQIAKLKELELYVEDINVAIGQVCTHNKIPIKAVTDGISISGKFHKIKDIPVINLDLGEIRDCDAIRITQKKGLESEYSVEISTDGVNYSLVKLLDQVDEWRIFKASKVRFVRVTFPKGKETFFNEIRMKKSGAKIKKNNQPK